jgi:hypothetical protein
MSARTLIAVMFAVVILGGCAKKRSHVTNDEERLMARMLEAAERDPLDAGPNPNEVAAPSATMRHDSDTASARRVPGSAPR